MTKIKLYEIKENINAILLSVTVPLLAIGKAAIAIPLLMLLLLNYKNIIAYLKNANFKFLLKQPITILLLITITTSAITTPYSLDSLKSISTLLRTIILFPIIFLIAYSATKYSDSFYKIFPKIILFLVFVLLFLQNFDKKTLNALTLCIPLLFIEKYKINKMISILFFFILNYLIIISYSKASLLAIIIFIIIYTLFYSLKNMSKKIFFFLVTTLSCLLIPAIWWLDTIQYETNLIETNLSFAPTYLIDLHRQIIWRGSLLLSDLSPWVGHGINASNYHTLALMPVNQVFHDMPFKHPVYDYISLIPGHPHNWILEFLLDTGLIGLIPILALVSTIFITIIKHLYKTQHPALLALLAIQGIYWGTGLFNFSFWNVWWQVSYFLYSSIAFSLYLHGRKAYENVKTP